VNDGEVLNGIAYDAENDRIFVTGKKWPSLFEIRITPVELLDLSAPAEPEAKPA
jgi:glutamine cyclotransferase